MTKSSSQRIREMMDITRRVSQIPGGEIRRAFDYNTRLLPHPMLARLEEQSSRLHEAVGRTGASLGYPGWNLLYYTLLCSLNSPQAVVLETGTNLGFSTIVLAQALRDSKRPGRVHTVEISQDFAEQARDHLEEATLADLVEIHVGDSLDLLPSLLSTFERLDFAFIDGDHSAASVEAEFQLILPLVRGCGGSVFFDNASGGGVAVALSLIRERHGGNMVEFPNCSWGPPGAVLWQP